MISTSDPTTRFVPEGTGPKVYSVICTNASDWKEIDSYILNENELDGIPNRAIGCVSPYKTCNRMASYEMSDAEAEQLRNHPKVMCVEHDRIYYQGTYDDSDITLEGKKLKRYGYDVKNSRGIYDKSTSDWLSRTSGNIWRSQSHIDPWDGLGDGSHPVGPVGSTVEQYGSAVLPKGDESMILEGNPEYHGDGTGVDIIVRDESSWFGHIEFVKTGVGEPTNFVGENVLKSGFAASATTGKCGALDIILHSPYYIDPDSFESDSSNRLTTRWDGTTVPTDAAAKSWWGNDRCPTNITVKLIDSSNAANFKLFTMSTGSVAFTNGIFIVQYSVSLTSSGGTLSNGEVYVEITETINGTLERNQEIAGDNTTYSKCPWTFTYDLVSSTNTPNNGEVSIFGTSGNDLYFAQNDKSGVNRATFLYNLITYGSDASVDASRSLKYVSRRNGGLAIEDTPEAFGEFTIGATSYTEAKCNGSNTAFQTGNNADHGTPCMSQVYGKTHGWAFNANKWFIAMSDGTTSVVQAWNMIKVFHQLKPNNPAHGTKDSTVISQSYSHYKEIENGWYAYFRGGTPEVIVKTGTRPTSPKWLTKFYIANKVQYQLNRWGSTHAAGTDIADAGVIMVNSGGNNNQKLVVDDHPDYDNYVATTNNRTLNHALGESGAYTANRITFPGSTTTVTNYNGTGKEVHRSFQIGALDDQKESSTQERKTNYSNMGEGIDCWIQTHGWGASDGQGTASSEQSRYDKTYTIGGVTSLESKDERFTGTSSACPCAAGFLSTKLGLHRDWTWVELKDWLKNRVTEQTTDAMYQGTEATTSDDTNWETGHNLQGGNRRILWDADSTPMPSDALLYIGQCDGLTVSGNGLTILNI